jgi:hypothetical protein
MLVAQDPFGNPWMVPIVDILEDIEHELNVVEVSIPNSAISFKNLQARLAEQISVWSESNLEVASPPASSPDYLRDIYSSDTAIPSSSLVTVPSRSTSQSAYHDVTASVDGSSTVNDPQVLFSLADDYTLPAITQQAPKETTAYGWGRGNGHWRCGSCEVYQFNADEKVHERASDRWICCSCGGENSCLLDVGCAYCS